MCETHIKPKLLPYYFSLLRIYCYVLNDWGEKHRHILGQLLISVVKTMFLRGKFVSHNLCYNRIKLFSFFHL